MEEIGWTGWEGKKVYLKVRNSTHPYTGKVIEVDTSHLPIVWMTIIDKYEKRVTFSVEEILKIVEDEI